MWVKKASLGLVFIVGSILFVFPIVADLFGKTNGVEQLTGDLRDSMRKESIQKTRADFNTLNAMSEELQKETLPDLPKALNMSPEEFNSFMMKKFPAVTEGVPQLNTALPRFDRLVTGLETQAPNFRQADSIPTGSVPSTIVPYLFLVPGGVLMLSSGFGLYRTLKGYGGRAGDVALIASTMVGVVLIGANFGFSVNEKAKSVDSMTQAFDPVFSKAGATQTRKDMDMIQEMSDQLQRKTLPSLAEGLSMDKTQFGSFMQKSYPDVAKGVNQLDSALLRFQGLVAGIEGNQRSFQKAAQIPTADSPTTSLVWWLNVPGALLLVVPVAAFATCNLGKVAVRARHSGAV